MNPMNCLVVLAAVLVVVSDATIIIGAAGGTVATGTAAGAAALAGVGGLALGAGLVGLLALGRRGKRSVATVRQTEEVFNVVAAADTYGCALKLVCLVEAKPANTQNEEDKLIMTLFPYTPALIAEEEVKTAHQAYDYAAALGAHGGKDSCNKVFYSCPFNYGTMISYLEQLRQ